jgi:hypothetical protein
MIFIASRQWNCKSDSVGVGVVNIGNIDIMMGMDIATVRTVNFYITDQVSKGNSITNDLIESN